jgi:hypothetical protein
MEEKMFLAYTIVFFDDGHRQTYTVTAASIDDATSKWRKKFPTGLLINVEMANA